MPKDKQMGTTTIVKQVGGYSTVPRTIAQAFRKHLQELGLYVFLLSLPDGWEYKKCWLEKETGIGHNKLNRMLNFLSTHGLVKTWQEKQNGKFASFCMEVYDGKNFDQLELSPLFRSPWHGFRGTETVATEIDDKILDIEITDNKKEDLKIYCASDAARQINEQKLPDYEPIPIERIKSAPMLDKPIATDEKRRELIERKAHGDFKLSPDEWYEKEQKLIWFEMFWESYPKKRDKVAARKSWEKNKLEAIGEKIVADVLDRSQRDVQWQDKQFIPYPATYLNHQRWTDEIITKQKGTPKNDNQQPRNESPSASGARILENGFRKYFGNGKLT